MIDIGGLLAHAGHGENGLIAGLLHPIIGLDHLLAAVAVGMLAALMTDQTGARKAVWLLPVMFLTGMIIGGALGLTKVALPGVEIGIAASVIALGIGLVVQKTRPLWASAGPIAVFAIFHGHAHLSEYGSTTGIGGYVVGLLVATGLLHVSGVALARMVTIRRGTGYQPVSGTTEHGLVARATNLQTRRTALIPVRIFGSALAAVGILMITGLL